MPIAQRDLLSPFFAYCLRRRLVYHLRAEHALPGSWRRIGVGVTHDLWPRGFRPLPNAAVLWSWCLWPQLLRERPALHATRASYQSSNRRDLRVRCLRCHGCQCCRLRVARNHAAEQGPLLPELLHGQPIKYRVRPCSVVLWQASVHDTEPWGPFGKRRAGVQTVLISTHDAVKVRHRDGFRMKLFLHGPSLRYSIAFQSGWDNSHSRHALCSPRLGSPL